MRAAVLTGALVALFAHAAAARAQAAGGLAQARDLYVRAEFEAAEVAFETELAAARDATTAAEAHRYLAALASILGAPESAAAHALAAVALVPDITPPPGAPPEVGQHLVLARRATSGEPLRLRIAPAEPDLLRAALDPPVDGVVARIELVCNDAARRAHRAEGPPPSVALDSRAIVQPFRCSASGGLRSGAPLLEARYAADADGASEPPWAWIGAAAAVAAAGIVLAVVLLTSARRDGARIDDIVVDP
jgi:hypothetical protein